MQQCTEMVERLSGSLVNTTEVVVRVITPETPFWVFTLMGSICILSLAGAIGSLVAMRGQDWIQKTVLSLTCSANLVGFVLTISKLIQL